jgi:hypothetical protein
MGPYLPLSLQHFQMSFVPKPFCLNISLSQFDFAGHYQSNQWRCRNYIKLLSKPKESSLLLIAKEMQWNENVRGARF